MDVDIFLVNFGLFVNIKEREGFKDVKLLGKRKKKKKTW